ncbi:G-alpha-domain-containing protein [Laetiporus sulphureus 93-53]|uniref:G-alpha-domain-containing protein n=1 Tax=Laetiporus sulphureus 93-53 TaxID=1314785 RepID=A0A165DDP2_9APHY|nr:G-alpha-domain-containing protein [Laetiporus sulphureus 93-53]KZT04650.1 G-alpha-domain-containing protein [Laetiporus sulphureus 93-53]
MAVLTMDSPDPLTLAMAPPKDESPADRWAREQREAQARLISEQIDAHIKAEKQAMKKRGKPVKVLLLGQSESGKSTTVKNFQMAYAYSSFLQERSAWRAVIHLNLVRSINTILDTLGKELSDSRSQPQSTRSMSPARSHTRPSTAQVRPTVSDKASTLPRPSTARTKYSPSIDTENTLVNPVAGDLDPDTEDDGDGEEEASSFSTLTDKHRVLQLRLAPLRHVQRDLEQSLGAATSEAPGFRGDAAPWTRQEDLAERRPREFFITSRTGWKSALNRVKSSYNAVRRASLGSREDAGDADENAMSNKRKPYDRRRGRPISPFAFMNRDDSDDDADWSSHTGECEPQAQTAAEIISSSAEDMVALWADPDVQAILARRKVKSRLEEGPGFFLNDVARVAARDYEPSDEDVVRARLRTMGVQEYRFKFDKGGVDAGREWILYDVGGARSSRHAWYPYFDDIHALIFLAPISCFDERLAEDHRVNRLQDSLMIWKAVCGSKLLRHVQLILFLNKCDLLQKKLSRGVRVVKYVPSYGDRPNDAQSVAKYFRQQFKDVFMKQSPEKRTFYSYLTSVIDTKATAITVATVRDGIQRNYMKDADIL